jgi:hypothetical protein
VRQGRAWCGWVGTGEVRHAEAWPGLVWRGAARQGRVRVIMQGWTDLTRAAKAARLSGVTAGDRRALLLWMRRGRRRYYAQDEPALLTSIGSKLADLEAQALGYKDAAHRAEGEAYIARERERWRS